jgi:ankyrin repeat protein
MFRSSSKDDMSDSASPTEALLRAAARGDLELLKRYAERQGTLASSALAIRLLEEALAAHQFHVAEWLLGEGVNLNVKDDLGCTPLQGAIYRGNTLGVEFLLCRGGAIDQPNREGNSVLHSSIDAEVQAAIYETDLHGRHVPASDKITRLLIKFGANPNALNSSGQTPLDWAIKHQHRAAECLLRNLGATTGRQA